MLFCKACNRQTLHVCQETNCNHILHLLLSIVTCGLWLPIWLLAAISSSKSTPICTACGSKPDNPALRFALAVILLAILLAFFYFVGTSHGQSAEMAQLRDLRQGLIKAAIEKDRATNDGVLFETLDEAGQWQLKVAKEIEAANIKIDPSVS
jgi:hypothetical protein